MTRDEYERDLKRRQEEHLRSLRGGYADQYWQPCMHDNCPNCVGTGVGKDGGPCVHNLSCPCPKCSPQCLGVPDDTGIPPVFPTCC